MKNHAQRRSASIIAAALLALVAVALFASACGKKADNSANETGPYRKSLNVADQAAAIRSLQTIYGAQTQYMLSHGEDYGTFEQLAQDNYLDQRFKSTAPVVEGYVFTIKLTPKSGSSSAMYTINADPKEDNPANATGARHLYMDATSNVIHANATRTATVNDPPLQP
ncbi:MAG: hypothetical protein QOC96_350 [Acidobacteriota bacterium]|jgi:hypothetical protein|nr:hypothetical protein [Acidobacteriota bacterium]